MMRSLLVCLAAVACTAESPAEARAVLHYFDVRGLAQAPRLMLKDLGLPFTEVRHTRETWAAAKEEGIASGLLPFGQVPVLEHFNSAGERTVIAQSVAIMQFLARHYGYYGEGIAQQAQIDMLVGAVGDLRKRYSMFVYNKAALTDATLLETYEKDLATWTTHYEKFLGDHKWVGGAKDITFADIMLFDLIDTCVLRVKRTALDNLPYLTQHYGRVLQRKAITAYLTSEENHKYANGASATFDTPSHTPPAMEEEL